MVRTPSRAGLQVPGGRPVEPELGVPGGDPDVMTGVAQPVGDPASDRAGAAQDEDGVAVGHGGTLRTIAAGSCPRFDATRDEMCDLCGDMLGSPLDFHHAFLRKGVDIL
ncbi:hypothetical protein GCM10017559_33470 [Streptosporangium longisporum]|uniref:Uncharacterized protein n=1 Tax=Streptosporangium longisporum TaxID=46187 RepID=A0ABP6KFR9_9ACTN